MTGFGRAPVLVVALDMGDGTLIRHWSRQGRLPNFAALAREGASMELESTAEVLHTSTWPTFATGVLPGRHGLYYPYQPTPGQQFARRIGANQCAASTFWKHADIANRATVVYDIPETFPEPGFSGTTIYDLGTWAQYGRTSAQPASLLKELTSRFGRYPLGYEAMRLGFDRPEGIAERLLRSIRYKGDTAAWLLQRQPWDLAVIGFGETHCGGHYLWPAGASGPDPEEDDRFEPLCAVYAEIDAALGSLRASLPPDATVVVASGDGVRPNHCGWHLLPAVLARLGYASGGQSPPSGEQSAARPSLLGSLRQLVPIGLKQRIEANLPLQLRNQIGLWAQAAAYDWSRTRAFALPTDLEGCIRINRKGREPRGIVEPGAEYDDLCREIRASLEELVNPATGAPAVRRVWIRNEIYPGAQQEELPDLIVTWNDGAAIGALTSPRLGRVEGANPDIRPGTHSTSGFMLAGGAAIPKSHVGRGRLVDVAPTILQFSGIEPPSDLDGRPMTMRQQSGMLAN